MHGNLSRIRQTFATATLIALMLGSAACASRPRGVGEGDSEHDSFVQEGLASYYHDSLHGNPTASGEPYDKNALSAAHRTLPLGTRIVVENLENGRSIELRINDRGPFVELLPLKTAAGRLISVFTSRDRAPNAGRLAQPVPFGDLLADLDEDVAVIIDPVQVGVVMRPGDVQLLRTILQHRRPRYDS